MTAQVHRKCEPAITLRTRQPRFARGLGLQAVVTRPLVRGSEPEHARDSLNLILANAAAPDSGNAALFAFLAGELSRKFHADRVPV